MNVVVVEQRDGKPHIRWTAAILLACVLGLFMAAIAVGVYFLLSGAFSSRAAIIGFWVALIIVGSGIVRAVKNPASPTKSF